jgi:hypothetical protein
MKDLFANVVQDPPPFRDGPILRPIDFSQIVCALAHRAVEDVITCEMQDRDGDSLVTYLDALGVWLPPELFGDRDTIYRLYDEMRDYVLAHGIGRR